MSRAPFRIERLNAQHNRAPFDFGVEALNRYLRQQARQDERRRVTACFLAIDKTHIAGYYTLASASLLLDELPNELGRRLPRYPTVPAVRLGRLAVDRRFQGLGLGGALLADAIERSIRSEIAAYALVVDAKDEVAVRFYRHHGFLALFGAADKLFLPLATVATRAEWTTPDVHEPKPNDRSQDSRMTTTIYHNPRCGKSRDTLTLLRAQGIEPTIVEYLKTPPTADELERILGLLGIDARELLRRGEKEYKEAGLDNPSLDRVAIIAAMVRYPILIERPIVITDKGAAIGRPPENVLKLLPS